MSAKRQEQVGSERESDESEKDDRDKMSNQKWLVEDGPHKEREIRWIEEKRKKKRNEGFRYPNSEEPICITNDFTLADEAHLDKYK